MTLEHFRYPDIFIRRTKKAYISIVTDEIIEIAMDSGTHDYDAVKRTDEKNWFANEYVFL